MLFKTKILQPLAWPSRECSRSARPVWQSRGLMFGLKFRLLCLPLALSVALFSLPVLAESIVFKSLLEGGDSLLERRDYVGAEKSYRAALAQIAPAEPTSARDSVKEMPLSEEGRLRHMVGKKLSRSLSLQGKFREARQTLETALQELPSPTALDEQELARAYRLEGQLNESALNYRKSIADLKKSFPLSGKEANLLSLPYAEKVKLSTSLLGLASVLQDMGHYEECEQSLKENLALFEAADKSSSSQQSLSLAQALEGLAALSARQGKFVEAEALFNKALALKTENGVQGPELCTVLLPLSRLYFNEEKMEQGEATLKRALTLCEGAGSQERAVYLPEILKGLSEHYLATGNFAAAKKPATTLLSLTETLPGKQPRQAEAEALLAEVNCNLKDFEAAISGYKRAIAVEEAIYGTEGLAVARYLNELGLVYLTLGEYDQARPCYERALKIVEKRLGAEHANVAACLNNLALLELNGGNAALAESLTTRGLRIRRLALGEKHPFVARNLVNLAEVEISLKKFSEAETCLKEALAIQEASLGEEHSETTETMLKLANFYMDEKKFDLSQQLLERVLKADRRHYGEESYAVLSDCDLMVKVLGLAGLTREAAPYATLAHELRAKLDGLANSAGKQSMLENMPKPPSGHLASRPVRDKWALVIGVSTFKDSSINLKYAAKDATDFRNYLVNDAGFKSDHVRLLTNQGASRENIVAALGDGWLRHKAHKDDLVVIFISSHGSAAKKEVSNANFILPYESNLSNVVLTGIPMQWFTVGVKEMLHADRVLLVLDVCHGGAVVNSGDKAVGRVPAREVDVRHVPIGEGQLVLASSLAGQLSWESSSYQNSVFTHRLIESLKSRGRGTGIKQAFASMKDKVEDEVLRERGQMQTPVLMDSSWRGGDLALACPVTSDVKLEPIPGRSLPPRSGVKGSPGKKH